MIFLNKFLLILFFNFFFFVFEIFGDVGSGSGSNCRLVSELNTCTWIDYNAWTPSLSSVSKDAKQTDALIQSQAKSITNEECKWAYIGYYCASSFPRCNENQDGPLPVCRDTCLELVEKCDAKYLGGITLELCNSLPEIECTADGISLNPNFYFFTFILIFYFLVLREPQKARSSCPVILCCQATSSTESSVLVPQKSYGHTVLLITKTSNRLQSFCGIFGG